MAGKSEPVNHWEDCSGELAQERRGPSAPQASEVVDLIPASIRERAGSMPRDEFQYEVERLRDAARQEELQERINTRIRRNIPKRYQSDSVSLDSYICDRPEQQRIVDSCRLYVRSFSDRLADGQGMLLMGRPGTGKTHIACSVAKDVIRRGYSVRYLSVIEIMRRIKETYQSTSPRTERQVIHDCIEPDLLVLEEVGTQHNTDFERLKMFEVIDGRCNEDKPSILISNYGKQKLQECLAVDGIDKTWDRIQERCVMFGFTWDSFRTRRRHG